MRVDFWDERDEEVRAMRPAEIGQILSKSEQAVGSIIGMLAEAGKVRICSIERVL